MSKLVFFPWATIQASESVKMQTWTATGDFKVDHYTGQSVATVSSRVVGGQIYIFGHSSPGSDTISNDNNDSLTYKELGDRLVASGLKRAYSGALKIYACNSGTSDTSFSFAKKFAKYMYFDKQYIFLRVYGYKSLMNSKMRDYDMIREDDGGVYRDDSMKLHKKPHKWSVAADIGATSIKAKDVRSYFSPFG